MGWAPYQAAQRTVNMLNSGLHLLWTHCTHNLSCTTTLQHTKLRQVIVLFPPVTPSMSPVVDKGDSCKTVFKAETCNFTQGVVALWSWLRLCSKCSKDGRAGNQLAQNKTVVMFLRSKMTRLYLAFISKHQNCTTVYCAVNSGLASRQDK